MVTLAHFALVAALCVAATQGQTCSSTPGQDINLPNLSSRNGTALSACCGLCSSTSGCRAYSWNDYQGGTCWFKSGTGPLVPNSGVTTGVLSGGGGGSYKILAFYHGTWDVAHISFCREANRYLPGVAAANGFTYESTTDWNRMNDNTLANYDVILLLDDKPQSSSQRSAFQRFLENGGGAMAFHVSAFTTNNGEWSWFHNTLLGSGNFRTNTWKPTANLMQTENRNHPALANTPETFRSMPSEWYGWTNDIRTNNNIQILLSIHPSAYPVGTDPNQSWYSGYYPIAWANKNLRFIYYNVGHNDIDYSNGNADLSQTFGDSIQNRFIFDSWRWLSQGNRIDRSPLMKAMGY